MTNFIAAPENRRPAWQFEPGQTELTSLTPSQLEG